MVRFRNSRLAHRPGDLWLVTGPPVLWRIDRGEAGGVGGTGNADGKERRAPGLDGGKKE